MQGPGNEAVRTWVEFSRQQFSPPAFRMTIATFNVRARKVARVLGFHAVDRFAALTYGQDYDIFTGTA